MAEATAAANCANTSVVSAAMAWALVSGSAMRMATRTSDCCTPEGEAEAEAEVEIVTNVVGLGEAVETTQTVSAEAVHGCDIAKPAAQAVQVEQTSAAPAAPLPKAVAAAQAHTASAVDEAGVFA